ncbi:MAG: hypothetical protein IPK65_08045 [Gammaproteobacteria bacterium]|nr:hypothetical protein [Gammaproteobacteria bacterium]
MYKRKPLFHAWGALDRGRFVAGILFVLGALLTLALVTLDGQTGGDTRISGLGFGVNLVLMAVLMLLFVPLTLRRALDLGWSVPKAFLGLIGSVLLFPLLTLVFMTVPGRGAEDADAPRPLPMLAVIAAPVAGVAAAMMVTVVFSRF